MSPPASPGLEALEIEPASEDALHDLISQLEFSAGSFSFGFNTVELDFDDEVTLVEVGESWLLSIGPTAVLDVSDIKIRRTDNRDDKEADWPYTVIITSFYHSSFSLFVAPFCREIRIY
jgi:hypothetical protein